jgi:hypothetical protein
LKKLISSVLPMLIVIFLLSNAALADSNEKTLVQIDDDLMITKLKDGRIEPVKNAKDLKENKLDKILLEMGFEESKISEMSLGLKKDIVIDGGKAVETTFEEVNLSTDDAETGTTVSDSGKSFGEVENKIKAKLDKLKEKKNLRGKNFNEVENKKIAKLDKIRGKKNQSPIERIYSPAGASETQNGWDKPVSDHDFRAQTYLIYTGKTTNGSQYSYNAWIDFEWGSKPISFTKDSYGIVFGVKAEKWSSNHEEYVYHTGSLGGVYPFSVSLNDGEIYGTDWTFDWSSIYEIYETVGYGKQELRIPVTHKNTTMTVGGAYAHSHTAIPVGLSFGPASVTFSISPGDKWAWTESFTIENY